MKRFYVAKGKSGATFLGNDVRNPRLNRCAAAGISPRCLRALLAALAEK